MKKSKQSNSFKTMLRFFASISLFLLTLAGPHAYGQCRTGFVGWPDSTGYNFQFYDSSTATPVSWSWSFGDGGTSNVQMPVHTYTSSGYYGVCLTDSFSNGCVSTFCDTVHAGTPAVTCFASFSFLVNPATSAVSFTDQSSSNQPITSWSWDFGDSTGSALQSPSHTYPGPGTYHVCLTITTTGGGCSHTTCHNVSITSASCYAGFGWRQPGSALSVDFTDTSYTTAGSISSYAWDFGDSTIISTAPNPTHLYAAAGTYYVCLTITSSTGCTDSQCQSITVGSSPVCTSNFSWQHHPAGNVSFMDLSTASDPIVSWNWDFGDSTFSLTNNPSHTYVTGGSYYVCLRITTSTGCTSLTCHVISVTGPGSCSASFGFQVSGNSDYTFYNTSTPSNVMVSWTFGDGGNANSWASLPVLHHYTSASQFTVCMTIFDSLTMCSDTYCTIVSTVASPCTPDFVSQGDSTTGLSVSFTDASGGTPYAWSWNFGDGGSSTLQNPVHTYASFGTYYVCLAVLDTVRGCVDTLCRLINVADPCSPAFISFPDSTNPLGHQFFYMNSPCGTPSSIVWDFGDGTVDSSGNPYPSHPYPVQGLYNVCVCIVLGTDTFCDCDTVFAYRLSSGIKELSPLGQFRAYPNPFNTELNILFDMNREATVMIRLFDLVENEVRSMDPGLNRNGTHQYTLNTEGLASGFYLLKLDMDGTSATKKVFLMK